MYRYIWVKAAIEISEALCYKLVLSKSWNTEEKFEMHRVNKYVFGLEYVYVIVLTFI